MKEEVKHVGRQNGNYRARKVLRDLGYNVDVIADYSYRMVRSYRVSCKKIRRTLGWEPRVTVEESVKDMVDKVQKYSYTDFDNPRYYNIRWMQLLEECAGILGLPPKVVFLAPEHAEIPLGVVK